MGATTNTADFLGKTLQSVPLLAKIFGSVASLGISVGEWDREESQLGVDNEVGDCLRKPSDELLKGLRSATLTGLH